ncbi:MAG: hypothetical protein RQ758_07105, partial [Methanomicrobiaceae archaeon]|nr:hypothetical protein [Methanomicrobiaceae archaeon]
MSRLPLACMLLALLLLPAIASASCPAPAVYVVPASLNAGDITPEQAAGFNALFSRGMAEANPGIVVTSAQDIGAMLAHEQEAIESGTEVTIPEKTRAGYVARLTLSRVGSRYVLSSILTDADLVQAGAGNDTVVAGAGDDTVFGSDGADTILGGAGNDVLDGDDAFA